MCFSLFCQPHSVFHVVQTLKGLSPEQMSEKQDIKSAIETFLSKTFVKTGSGQPRGHAPFSLHLTLKVCRDGMNHC